MHIIQLVQHSIECALSYIDPILPDGGQRRPCEAAHWDVIKTQNTDILGNPKTHLQAVDHNAVSQQVVAADDSGTASLQNPGQVQRKTFVDEVRITGKGFVHMQTVGFHSTEESGVALPVYIGLQSAA